MFVDSHNINLTDIDHNEHGGSHIKSSKKCNMTPFVLMIALSVHAMFEGIALGLFDTQSQVINMMFAILIHKFAEGMSVSIAL